MKIPFRHRPGDILAALAVTGLTTWIIRFIEPQTTLAIVVLFYLIPVGISAVRWGMLPGFLAAFASFLLINYFFTEPRLTFKIEQVEEIVALLAFLILTVTLSRLVSRMKDGLSQAKARENELSRLYELSASLLYLTHPEAIMNTLAQHTLDALNADQVEILSEEPDNFLVCARETNRDHEPHQETIPMQGERTIIGEIRIWRAQPLSEAEKRLIRVFASQSSLAIERARLSTAEARAVILEESDKMKAALLSSVSHELRTPLATIKAAVSSLNSKTIPWNTEARKDLLLAIEEETDRLNQLVGNLLNMSRIEAGALRLQRHWNALNEIATSAIQKARLASHTHKILMDIPEHLPLLFVDEVLMEQVFVNLIDNSRKYSPAGTIIRVAAHTEPDHMLVRVSNEGPAVPQEDLERIFEKFHRVTASDKTLGTGLGLSICKGIIEAHHGQIWAENLDNGFAILFRLPLQVEGESYKLPDVEG